MQSDILNWINFATDTQPQEILSSNTSNRFIGRKSVAVGVICLTVNYSGRFIKQMKYMNTLCRYLASYPMVMESCI